MVTHIQAFQRKTLQRAGRQAGALLVEMALTLPILLLVVFGIVEYTIMFGAMIVMSNAANEAARQATVYRSGYSQADYETAAMQSLTSALPSYVGDFKNQVQKTVTPFACGDSVCLRLTLTYPNYKTNPLVSNYAFLPLPSSLTAQATTRVEPDGS
ncbi:pilus assembly protein [Limnobacter humi]|uniref:Pilus assembly protein n=2 Tax=Limnobacter humi TaxID=1778671 RepID=A0ABT1WIA8_9BURK|nr:pilus assembly protein [Limnobacter humi]